MLFGPIDSLLMLHNFNFRGFHLVEDSQVTFSEIKDSIFAFVSIITCIHVYISVVTNHAPIE